MDLNKAIENRRTVRKFKSKKPDWRNIIEAIDSARYAPMAGDIFTLKFIMVDNQEKIQEISEWAEQNFINQAQYVVVFVTNPERVISAYGERGKVFCRQQAGAAIQNFLLKITDFGLSTCWVGYFNENEIKKLLKIPEDYNIEGIFPIGYANEKPGKRKTRDLNDFLYFNQWRNNRMKLTRKAEGRWPEGFGFKIKDKE